MRRGAGVEEKGADTEVGGFGRRLRGVSEAEAKVVEVCLCGVLSRHGGCGGMRTSNWIEQEKGTESSVFRGNQKVIFNTLDGGMVGSCTDREEASNLELRELRHMSLVLSIRRAVTKAVASDVFHFRSLKLTASHYLTFASTFYFLLLTSSPPFATLHQSSCRPNKRISIECLLNLARRISRMSCQIPSTHTKS